MNRNCLSYWFPRLLESGIPVPRTEIVTTKCDLRKLLDGKEPKGFRDFMASLVEGVERIGEPCFLRTGQGSGKHQWKNTCFLKSREDLPNHIAVLVEWSELVDFLGLPHNVWAVRELLPTEPMAVCPWYGDFPLVPEALAFVKDGKVLCIHNYWPIGSIEEGGVPHPEKVHAAINAVIDCDEVRDLAQKVATVFKGDGAWSADILQTKRGWHVTDMAEAGRSFHVPECQNALILGPGALE